MFPPTTPNKDDPEWTQNLNMKSICPDCREDPPNLIEEFSSGDMVCGSCGLVLGDRIIDSKSEWRTFSNDDQGNDDPSRVGEGPNMLLNGSQLHTTIAYGDGSARSRDLLRAQSKSSGDKTTKGLLAAYKEIGAHCDSVGITKNVSDTAKHLFKMVDDAKAFKGKSQAAIIATCIFIACRQCDVPRTFREIFHMTRVSKKEIGRTFKALEGFFSAPENQRLAKNGFTSADPYKVTAATGAKALCTRYCSLLGLTQQKFTNLAEGLATKMTTVGDLAGRSPLSVAAACIWMASHLLNQPRSAKEIANVAGVSDGTVRTAYKHLYQERARLIEPAWIAKADGGPQAAMDRLPVA